MKKYLNQKGFSLLEVLMTLSTVSIIIFLLAGIPNSINLITKSKHLDLVREISSRQIEELRIASYNNLANGETSIVDHRIKLLPSGAAQLLIEECPISVCTNNEEAKKIKITVTWTENGKPQNSIIETIISSGGL